MTKLFIIHTYLENKLASMKAKSNCQTAFRPKQNKRVPSPGVEITTPAHKIFVLYFHISAKLAESLILQTSVYLFYLLTSSTNKHLAPSSNPSIMFAACDVLPLASWVLNVLVSRPNGKLLMNARMSTRSTLRPKEDISYEFSKPFIKTAHR